MENLNKQNFWEPQENQTREAVNVFYAWIDAYKKEVRWSMLFNHGYIENAETPYERKSEAPKFHDLPIEMQMGILQRFFLQFPYVSKHKLQMASSTPLQILKLAGAFRDLQERLDYQKRQNAK